MSLTDILAGAVMILLVFTGACVWLGLAIVAVLRWAERVEQHAERSRVELPR